MTNFKFLDLFCRLASVVFYVGPEWDSSDEEENEALVSTSIQSKKSEKKSSKALSEKKEDEPEEKRAVLYIGHLPSEFDDSDLKRFLIQFGKVRNVRIARSMKTGNPKGYAFVEFQDASVSEIVAETLNGYFLGNRRLVCNSVANPHEHLFFNTTKALQKQKVKKQIEKQRREKNLSTSQKLEIITNKLIQRERKRKSRMAELGIDYDFPGYEADKMTIKKLRQGEIEGEEGNSNKLSSQKESTSPSNGSSSKTSKESKNWPKSPSSKKQKKSESIDDREATKEKKTSNSTGSKTPERKKEKHSELFGRIEEKDPHTASDPSSEAGEKSINDKSKGMAEIASPKESVLQKRVIQSESKKRRKKDKRRRASVP